MITVPGMIVGALGGLIVTIIVILLWPKGRLRAVRPLLAAGLGLGAAYILMRLF